MKHLFALIFCTVPAFAYSQTPEFAPFCQELLQRNVNTASYDRLFSKEFKAVIAVEKIEELFKGLSSDTGSCISFSVKPAGPDRFELDLQTESKLQVALALHRDTQSNLFDGLSILSVQAPSVQVTNWQSLEKVLNDLDPAGQLSATLVSEDNSVQLFHHRNLALAIGSTFKLYVLGTLEKSIAEGMHQWNEIFPLKEEWKSLPSGVMHEWPAGQKITLQEYAEKMISVSDNTATDHLIHLLGRDNVTNILKPMGNTHEEKYLPFLTTLEMFKLKWAIPPAQTDMYVRMTAAERNEALNLLQQVPRTLVGTNGISFLQPTKVDTIEWFATTEENCRAMFYLAGRNNSTVRSMLSKNVLVLKDVGSDKSHWAYAGYKGGSDAGVLSMTYLLESKSGKRACFSITWNNSHQRVSFYRMADTIEKTLNHAEKLIP